MNTPARNEYGIQVGPRRLYSSDILAELAIIRTPESDHMMTAIEHIETWGTSYSGQSFDLLQSGAILAGLI